MERNEAPGARTDVTGQSGGPGDPRSIRTPAAAANTAASSLPAKLQPHADLIAAGNCWMRAMKEG